MNPILLVELFDVWGLDFMGFSISWNELRYIHVAVDYVSKWVEDISLSNYEEKSVIAILKRVSSQDLVHYGRLLAGGSHLCNRLLKVLIDKSGVCHVVATSYHPQSSRQV